MADPNYICPRCNGEYLPIVSRLMTQVDVGSTKLDVEATSYYLGDMLCSNGGGCGSAIAIRYCVYGLRKNSGNYCLSSPPGTSLLRCMACVHSSILHDRKMWGLNNSDLELLHRNDCAMIHWICGSKDQDETPSVSLLQKLGIKGISAVLCSGWLRWYGHAQRVMSLSNLSQTYRFRAPECKEDLERHGLNVSRLISVNKAWTALTCKTETLGQPVFRIACRCQPIGWDTHSFLV